MGEWCYNNAAGWNSFDLNVTFRILDARFVEINDAVRSSVLSYWESLDASLLGTLRNERKGSCFSWRKNGGRNRIAWLVRCSGGVGLVMALWWGVAVAEGCRGGAWLEIAT